MRYRALATDGDGTLIVDGHMAAETTNALQAWRRSGRKVILVTGETAEQLCEFPNRDLIDLIVAENGALLTDCHGENSQILCDEPPSTLIAALDRARIPSLRRGKVIFCADRCDQTALEAVTHGVFPDWQVVKNKKDIMLVPKSVNKESGLRAALKKLEIRIDRVIGVGDGENDRPLVIAASWGVALKNAVPSLKAAADGVAPEPGGGGIADLINHVLEMDR